MGNTLKELSEKLGVTQPKMKKLVNDLMLSGLVVKNGELYKLTENGIDFMRFINPPEKK